MNFVNYLFRRRNQRKRKETLRPPKNEEENEVQKDYPDPQREGPDLQSGAHPGEVPQDVDLPPPDVDLHPPDVDLPLLGAGREVLLDVHLLTDANARGHLAAPDLPENDPKREGKREEGVKSVNREARREDQEVRTGGQKVERRKVNLQRRKEPKQSLPRGKSPHLYV